MTPSLLVAYLLYFLTAAVPISEHAYYEQQGRTEARYVEFAEAVSEYVLREDAKLIDGDPVYTALLLSSVATFESYMRNDAMRCQKAGLGGAYGPYQLQGGKKKVCASFAQATEVAAEMLSRSWLVCWEQRPSDRLSFYTDGKCKERWWRARSRYDRARRFYDEHPMDFDVDAETEM